jgi:hypothetical protein
VNFGAPVSAGIKKATALTWGGLKLNQREIEEELARRAFAGKFKSAGPFILRDEL